MDRDFGKIISKERVTRNRIKTKGLKVLAAEETTAPPPPPPPPPPPVLVHNKDKAFKGSFLHFFETVSQNDERHSKLSTHGKVSFALDSIVIELFVVVTFTVTPETVYSRTACVALSE